MIAESLQFLASLVWAAVMWDSVRTLAKAWVTTQIPAGSATPATPPEVPEDLLALAMQEAESWAQEDVLRTIRERYELYHDWNRVRAAMGIGRRSDG